MAEGRERADAVTIRPRIGRWEVDANGEVSLIGSRCTSCDETYFPEQAVCGRCGGTSTEQIRLAGPARLFSYTIVHQLPSGFTAPMTVGYAELDGGVLVLAPIDATAAQLAPGMALDLHEGVTRIDEAGEPMLSYRFRPAAG
jgi:uncharacterized OB-fold protein